MTESFESVWYRSSPKKKSAGKLKWSGWAMEDSGTLDVSLHGLVFHGKHETRTFPAPVAIRYGRQGVDRAVDWSQLTFADGTKAMFARGGLLGWFGVYGANVRLAAYLTQAFSLGGAPTFVTADDARWKSGLVAVFLGMAGPVALLVAADAGGEIVLGLALAAALTLAALALARLSTSRAMRLAKRSVKRSN